MFQRTTATAICSCGFFIKLRQVVVIKDYFTIKCEGVGEYEEKRSRFIGVAIPVTTEQQAIEHINRIKKENFGARHNVYAYVLRDNALTRYSDDGEPHSTAGMPVLDVIKKSGLTDVLVVVTRYFGGVLLGTGGLVRAYTAAAKLGIENAGIVKMKYCNLCKAECSYSEAQMLERVINDNKGTVSDTVYTDKVEVFFAVPQEKYSEICDKITETFCGKIVAEKLSSDYSAVDF